MWEHRENYNTRDLYLSIIIGQYLYFDRRLSFADQSRNLILIFSNQLYQII